MQHIGIDARLNYYRTGGISTYTRRLIHALETLDATHQYTVFHSRKDRTSLTERFRHARLWTPCHHRLERLALSVELLRHRLDVFHSPDFIPPYRGARYHIITVHDLNFLYYPQFLTDESRRYYNDQIAQAVKQADHILADSTATQVDLVHMLNVPAEKITVHMLGVDESFRPLPQSALETVRQQLDLPASYLLFVGTFEPRKNIPGLLQAYQMLRAQLPDAPPMVLAGNRGWFFEETRREIEKLHLGAHVLWRENVPQAALPALYNLADALITPSFYEGFGFPALEAMACGTVPIVSDRASLPEVVGDVGALVDPDDPATITAAMLRVLTDSDWKDQMVTAGKARAATFTWENTARIVLQTYNAVTG
jgi:glycosyltransferase involved in cell wall biosynthesis